MIINDLRYPEVLVLTKS